MLKRILIALVAVATGSLAVISASAEPTALPYTFSAGTKARADEVNANFASLAAKLPANVIVVSPNAAGEVASGTDLLNALAAISGNGAGNRYVIAVAPGTYDLGTAGLVMKGYVDIVGAGRAATILKSSNGSLAEGSVQASANNSELRDLTVYNTSTGTNGVGVTMIAGASTLRNVGVVVQSAANGYGIRALYTPFMRDITVGVTSTVQAVAVDLDVSGSASIWDSSLTALGGNTSIGLRAQNATDVQMIRSTVQGDNASTLNQGIALMGTATATVRQSTVLVINTAASNAGISLTTSGSTTWVGVEVDNTAASNSNSVEVGGGSHTFSNSYLRSNTAGVVQTGGTVNLEMTYFNQANSGTVTCSGVGSTGTRFSVSC